MAQSQISGVTRLPTDKSGYDAYRVSVSVTGAVDATIPIYTSGAQIVGCVIREFVASGGAYPTIINVNSTGTNPVANITFSVASAPADVTLDVWIKE